MKKETLIQLVVAGSLILVAIAGRLVPHAPNFTPVAAAALFAGFYFRKSTWALAIPILALVLSDYFIGFYSWKLMASVYAALSFPVVLRILVQKPTALRVGSCAVLSSLVFFLIANLAVWMFTPFYDKSLSGLLLCFAAAIPFLKYTIAGNLFWSTVIFGSYGLITSAATRRATNELHSTLAAWTAAGSDAA